MKTCKRCKTIKPIEAFSRRSASSDGRDLYCKVCRRALKWRVRDRGVVTPGTAEKFWSRVEKTETCWLWRGGLTTDGYGRFFYGGADRPAHHVPLLLEGKQPPKWPMVSDHKCRVRNCVRPDHIRWVTQSTNSRENSQSCYALNRAKKVCSKGHPLSGENVALIQGKNGRGQPTLCRYCLTCYPQYRNNPNRLTSESEIRREPRPNRGRPVRVTR